MQVYKYQSVPMLIINGVSSLSSDHGIVHCELSRKGWNNCINLLLQLFSIIRVVYRLHVNGHDAESRLVLKGKRLNYQYSRSHLIAASEKTQLTLKVSILARNLKTQDLNMAFTNTPSIWDSSYIQRKKNENT